MNQRNKFFRLLGILFIAAAIYYFFTTSHSRDLVLIGTVDANQVIVSPKIEGRIEKLYVDEGSEVKIGDPIAALDSAELAAQKEAAEAMLRSNRSRISESKATELMTRGATTSGVANARARLQSAKASLVEAQAQLVKLQQDNDRIQVLAKQGVASKQDLDRSNADLNAQQAHVAALEEQVRAADADLNTAIAQTHQNTAVQHAVAENQAQAANAQAQIAEINARLAYTRIVSPVNGIVSVRVAREGEVVNVGSPIVTIVDLNDTWVRASVPETAATNIGIGDTLRVRLPNGQIVNGKVITKGAEGDFATQRDVSRMKRDIKTVALKLSIDNSRKALVPGMTAEVLISPAQASGKTQTRAQAGQ